MRKFLFIIMVILLPVAVMAQQQQKPAPQKQTQQKAKAKKVVAAKKPAPKPMPPQNMDSLMRESAKVDKAFVEGKIGKPLPSIGALPLLHGGVWDVDSIHQPTMVYIGFAGCAPCTRHLPLLIKASTEKQYKDYRFVYLTYNDSTAIAKDLTAKKITQLGNVKIAMIQKQMLIPAKLIRGYPMAYFIKPNGQVQAVMSGDKSSMSADDLQNDWWEKLDAIGKE